MRGIETKFSFHSLEQLVNQFVHPTHPSNPITPQLTYKNSNDETQEKKYE